MGETQDTNEIHGPHQSLDNYHWPKGFMKIEIPLITYVKIIYWTYAPRRFYG